MKGHAREGASGPDANGPRARRPSRRARQLALPLRTWGGARKGAGRKPKIPGKSGIPHRVRPRLERRLPVHVTIRMAEHVWNLRSRRSFRILAAALRAAMDRLGVRLIQFSVQSNHIHLLVEATDRRALGRAIKGLSVRIARGLNGLMRRRGRAIADRYHARALRTPTEVRRAVHYIRENARRHAAQWGHRLPPDWVDPYSSDAPGRRFALPEPVTWLLRRQHRAVREGPFRPPSERRIEHSRNPPSPRRRI